MEDDKGKLIGLPYDYEYRGWKHERNRNFSLWKLDAVWGIIGLLLAVAGFAVLFKSPSQIFWAIICFAITALMGWMIYRQHKKHNELMEIIKSYKRNRM